MRVQQKLALILSMLAFVAVLMSTWILTAFDRHHFREYVEQNKDLRNERIAAVLAESYQRHGGWGDNTGLEVGSYCAREGIQLRLLDSSRQEIWALPPEGQAVHGSNHDHAGHDQTLSGDLKSTDLIEVKSGDKLVGFAEVSYIDPESYTTLDYHYWQAMTQGVITAVVPVVLLGWIVSLFLSRRVTRPMVNMIGLARKMREGRLDVRIDDAGGDEMGQLANSLNHLAEELQKQDKLRRNLTADVAHELRTPLTTLKSHIEALVDGVWEPTAERLQDCQMEVERLIGLVASLQSLTQAESESLMLHRQPTDIVEATKSVVNLMEAAFASKEISLSFAATESAETGAAVLLIDPDKWKQILMNLLQNALKYTESGGKVKVLVTTGAKTRLGDKTALIEVSDTGEGIAQEHLPYIFERFYRVDPSRTRSTGGAGIGLAIVKKLVEAHGGTIVVQSEPGVGSSFTIMLPGK